VKIPGILVRKIADYRGDTVTDLQASLVRITWCHRKARIRKRVTHFLNNFL